MMTDNEILSRLAALSKNQAEAECEIIAYLVEVSQRSLHLKKAYRSLFEFTFQFLKCSEATASRRVAVVRISGKFPVALEMLRTQQVTLTSLALIAPHLTHENQEYLLKKVVGASKRETEKLIAGFSPEKSKRDVIRPVATSVPDTPLTGETPPKNEDAAQLTGEALVLGDTAAEEKTKRHMVRIAFDAPTDLAEKIERLKEIHAHKLKDSSLAEVLEMAVDLLLDKTAPERKSEPRKKQKKDSPTQSVGVQVEARRPPATVQREVWKRDGGQCSFKDHDGRRCSARRRLQIDHIKPWALGGSSKEVHNLRLLCQAHNLLAAERYFPAKLKKTRCLTE